MRGVGVIRWVDGKESEYEIRSADDIRNFLGDGVSVTQVNLSKYHKVYYSMEMLERYGIVDCKVVDMNGDTHFMHTPLLYVKCDDSEPVCICEQSKKIIEGAIDFY